MSKSLKNFTTIRSTLSQPEWNARSLRIAFLMGAWQDGIEVTDGLTKAVEAWDSKMNNFFLKAIDVSRHPTQTDAAETGSSDKQLLDALENAKSELDKALCDSFNTPVAMRVLSDLVTEFNSAKTRLADATVLSTARWVTRIVTIFGLDSEGDLSDETRVGWSGIDIPAPAKPYVYSISQLRDNLRQQARSGALDHGAIRQLAEGVSLPEPEAGESSKPYKEVSESFVKDVEALADGKATASDFLTLCDKLRDTHLWNLGIYLEDRDPPQHALVRPVDKALATQREEQRLASEAKKQAKAKKEAEDAEKARLQAEKAKISHLEMFKTEEYSEWDEQGIPTKDTSGEEVSKSKRKKLVKEWEKQKKLHETWLAGKQA